MIKTDKYIVGYADLLGAKSKTIQDDADSRNLNSLSELYQMAKKNLEFVKEKMNAPELHIKIFSDNIAVAQKITKKTDTGSAVIKFLTNLQLFAFMKEGWLMRGCITCGDLYVSSVFVWGKALIDACRAEEELAVYPRILISPEVMNRVMQKGKNTEDLNIGRDFDGEFYLEYYNIMDIYRNSSRRKKLEAMKAYLVEMLADTENQPKLKQKAVWLTRRHNEYCRKRRLPEYLITSPENIINVPEWTI